MIWQHLRHEYVLPVLELDFASLSEVSFAALLRHEFRPEHFETT
jgi:hypothetical protein